MSRRPVAVTAACLLGALAALATAVLLSLPSAWAVPPTAAQRAVGLAAIAATVAGLVGLWRMRRWGVMLIAVLLAARAGYSLLGGAPWNPAGLAGPVVLLLIGAAYWRRMT